MCEKLTITLPDGLRQRAHAAGFNISGTCAKAIERSVIAIEKETGVNAAKQSSPAVNPVKGVTS